MQLVFGVTGLIGSEIVRKLLDLKKNVTVLVCKPIDLKKIDSKVKLVLTDCPEKFDPLLFHFHFFINSQISDIVEICWDLFEYFFLEE